MLLSSVLPKMQYHKMYNIVSEKEFSHLDLAESNLHESYCTFLDSFKYIDNLGEAVSMIITTKDLAQQLSNKPYGLCIVESPRELFFMIHNFLSDKEGYIQPSFQTKIGENCRISPLASIAINNVVIGDSVTVEEFVVIRENTFIGDNSVIRAGCKIGGHGFEFKRKDYGIVSVAHAGGVKIGKNVEIQYNSCIDRAVYPWDNTIISDYCKIDNLVHIAHGVKLGENIMIVANSCIGGRTVVKDNTWIGLSATTKNGINIGKNARVNMGAVVTKTVNDNSSVTGNFAIDHKAFLQNLKNTLEDG